MHPIKNDMLSRFECLSLLPHLEYLIIRNTRLGASSFSRMSSLLKLSLYSCDLSECPSNVFNQAFNLRFLEMFHCRNISQIKFNYLPNLKWLRISKCEIYMPNYEITDMLNSGLIGLKIDLTPDDFSNLRLSHQNLNYLEISASNLIKFDANCISELSGLRHFVFSSETVEEINLDYEFLSRLESLKLITENLEINGFLFTRLVNLKCLDLSTNVRLNMNSDLFSGMRSLERLNLESTVRKDSQSILGYELFRPLRDLTVLSLSHNYLTSLDPNLFSNTPFLSKLDLSWNNLKLECIHFERLKNLKFLDLSQNKFETIEDEVFSSLSALEVLNLSYCKINWVCPSAFHGLLNLKKLNIQGNSVSSVPLDVKSFFESLEQVVLI